MSSVCLRHSVLGLGVVVTLALGGLGTRPGLAGPRLAASPVPAAGQAAGVTRITPEQFVQLLHQGNVVLVDVRSYGSYLDAHLPDAMSIPLDKLEGSLRHLRATGATIVLYCSGPAGEKSGRAAALLLAHGFERVYCLDGGFQRWVASGRVVFVQPTET